MNDQWLSLSFISLGEWGLFNMYNFFFFLIGALCTRKWHHNGNKFCQNHRNSFRLPALGVREPLGTHRKTHICPQSKALSLTTLLQWNFSLLEDLARTLRPPGQQGSLRLWHEWYVSLRQHAHGTREIPFPAWLLWQLLMKHLVIKGLHVLPKSFGKEKQNLYSVLFPMWNYKLLLCSIK